MKAKIEITKRVGTEANPFHNVGEVLVGWLRPDGFFETTGSDEIHKDFFKVLQRFPDEPKSEGKKRVGNFPFVDDVIVDNQPHSQAYMKHQGIGQALNLFAEDESLQSAMDKAERWRNDLEEMREIGSSEEVKAINVLYDVLQTWLGQAIEASTIAQRVKTRRSR